MTFISAFIGFFSDVKAKLAGKPTRGQTEKQRIVKRRIQAQKMLEARKRRIKELLKRKPIFRPEYIEKERIRKAAYEKEMKERIARRKAHINYQLIIVGDFEDEATGEKRLNIEIYSNNHSTKDYQYCLEEAIEYAQGYILGGSNWHLFNISESYWKTYDYSLIGAKQRRAKTVKEYAKAVKRFHKPKTKNKGVNSP